MGNLPSMSFNPDLMLFRGDQFIPGYHPLDSLNILFQISRYRRGILVMNIIKDIFSSDKGIFLDHRETGFVDEFDLPLKIHDDNTVTGIFNQGPEFAFTLL